MVQLNVQPSWWKLYLIIFGGMGLMVFDAEMPFSELGHEITECGLLLLIYAMVAFWLHANSPILSQSPWPKANYENASEQPIELNREQTPLCEAMANQNGDSNHKSGQTIELLLKQME
jgi:hypothetical protein